MLRRTPDRELQDAIYVLITTDLASFSFSSSFFLLASRLNPSSH